VVAIGGVGNITTSVTDGGLDDALLAPDQFFYTPEATAGKNGFFSVHNSFYYCYQRYKCANLDGLVFQRFWQGHNGSFDDISSFYTIDCVTGSANFT